LVLSLFHRSKKILHLWEQTSICNLTGQQADSSIGTLASAHICAAFKNARFYYPRENSFFLMLLDNLLKEPLVIKDGCTRFWD
jgi:hypothetical protein